MGGGSSHLHRLGRRGRVSGMLESTVFVFMWRFYGLGGFSGSQEINEERTEGAWASTNGIWDWDLNRPPLRMESVLVDLYTGSAQNPRIHDYFNVPQDQDIRSYWISDILLRWCSTCIKGSFRTG